MLTLGSGDQALGHGWNHTGVSYLIGSIPERSATLLIGALYNRIVTLRLEPGPDGVIATNRAQSAEVVGQFCTGAVTLNSRRCLVSRDATKLHAWDFEALSLGTTGERAAERGGEFRLTPGDDSIGAIEDEAKGT